MWISKSRGLQARVVTWLILGSVSLAGLSACLGLVGGRQQEQVQARLVPQAKPAHLSGFQRAEGPRTLSFPADHGPHNDFQTEWWYFTGNLSSADGRHFGYQLTFFRRALLPPALIAQRQSAWGTSQAYMAHFALTDVDDQRYQAFERLARGAAGLAGAQADPFQVWLEDWRVEMLEPGIYRLYAAQAGTLLDITLVDNKGPILQGDHGYSRKGPESGQASFYYSLTRLVSSGTLQHNGSRWAVEGQSWMDHEFSTSVLASDQIGWDWFSIQLDDGSELMVFQIRKADGSIDPFSSGALVAPDGSLQHLSRQDFEIEVLSNWKSPRTQASYPASWRLSVPVVGLDLRIEPYLADQELDVSYAYWEGCVHVQGSRSGQPVQGDGYVELTGYAGSMAGEF
ncbi:MAG: lipocalin-like domain-containing protein [Chloroflexota bacterium]